MITRLLLRRAIAAPVVITDHADGLYQVGRIVYSLLV